MTEGVSALHPVARKPFLLISMPWIAGAAWKLHIPEGFALGYDKDRHFGPVGSVEWHHEQDRVFYRTELTEDRHYACGLRVEARAVENGVDLFAVVENQGTIEWPAYANLLVCLSCLAGGEFFDSDATRTFVSSGERMRTVRELIGGDREPGMTHFLTPPFEDPKDQLLAGRVDDGTVVRVREDGQYSVVFWWEDANRVDTNFNPMSCIHSHPQLGPLAPGGRKERRGWIRVVQGGPEEAERLITMKRP